MAKLIRPPKGLKKAGRSYWKKSLSEIPMDEAHDLERLTMACKCLDEVAEIEERVESDGRFVKNRYGNVVEHVGVKAIRDTRTLFVRIIRELGLDAPSSESRPPRKY